ncbi:T6D22.22 [Arabidopsis thaliana]|uniref:T6D22.22 n=1 Tax=Arabidopsis thaliana TaxID=3702 RepID=Q9LMZ5_ARATH|nr:T6D22.22 [Arabidopsis thaliana]
MDPDRQVEIFAVSGKIFAILSQGFPIEKLIKFDTCCLLRLNSPSTCTVTIEVLGHELDFAQVNDATIFYMIGSKFEAFRNDRVGCVHGGKNSRKGRFSSSKLKGKRAIELGAGCGVAGFALAMLGCDVVTTDQKEVLPLLKRNVEWNTSRIVQMNPGSAFGSLRVAELDWGNEDHITAVEPPFDYVIGTDVLGYEIRSTVVHEKMLQMWKDNFEVKTIPRSKMDGEYQDPSIHLYIMAQKSAAESSGNVSRDEVVIDTDETKCETKVPTGECHKRVEEEAVVTHGPRLNEDSLLMRLRDGKLSEWEMRRYGTVAAQLLRDVKIDVQDRTIGDLGSWPHPIIVRFLPRCRTWASLLNVADHCFEEFLYAVSIRSITFPHEECIESNSFVFRQGIYLDQQLCLQARYIFRSTALSSGKVDVTLKPKSISTS